MKRESGYYWVMYFGKWYVGNYCKEDKQWRIPRFEKVDEKDFKQISKEQLLPPTIYNNILPMAEEIKTLRELEIGDIFHSVKDTNIIYRDFVVRGNPEFNRGHGSATRVCVNISRNTIESKSCRMKVIKTDESAHKELYKQSPISIK